MKKRILSMLLVLLMLASIVPSGAMAADSVTYNLSNGVLTVSGTGVCTTGWKSIYGWDDETAKSVTKVIVNNGITEIGRHSFKGLSNLKSVTLPNTVVEIGQDAFENCSSLTSITLPESVVEMHYSAFNGCTGLKEIDIKNPEVTGGNFYKCDSIEKVSWGGVTYVINNGVLTVTGKGACESAFKLLAQYKDESSIKKVVIGNGITSVGMNSVYGGKGMFQEFNELESVVIADSVTQIAYHTFYKCNKLSSITIGSKVERIDEGAFHSTAYYYDDNNWETISGCQTLYVGNWLTNTKYLECKGEYIVRPGTRGIAARAFIQQTELESVVIPDGVVSICQLAFAESGIKSIEIPASVKFIGMWAFSYANKLKDIYFTGTEAQWNAIVVDEENEGEFAETLKNVTIHFNYVHHDHTYSTKVTAPTCTDYGYTTYTCTDCGYSYNVYGNEKGHNYVDGICTRCGAKNSDTTTPVTPTGFSDVASGSYCYDAVQWAVAEGITNGTDATHFSPNAGCTRAQVVTFLWRAAGSPDVSANVAFVDVSESSVYYKAIKWAVANGITKGTDATHFSPNATCTRGQVVTFMYRAAGEPAVSSSGSFSDVVSGSYCYNAVQWAVANGITKGTDSTHFSPNATCTRGQVVTFLYRAQ